MSTTYKRSEDVPSEVLARRMLELADAVGKRGEERDRELTRRVPAELDRDADLVLCEAAQRLVKLEAERDALAAHVERYRAAITPTVIDLVRCGIGANYGGRYLDEALEKHRDPLLQVSEAAPATSLARLKAEGQAEGAESFKNELVRSVRAPFMAHIEGVHAVWARRQAEDA